MNNINWNFLLQLIFYYFLLNVVIYFVSDFAMFPVPASSYQDKQLPHQIKITTSDGKTISAIYLKNEQASYTILYSHGNAEDLGSILPFLEILHSKGFSIFAYDYHGYGTSEGRATEKNTYLDIQSAYYYLTQILKIPPEKIILFGRSVGTGPTIELASKVQTAGVILESPMLTAYRVITVFPLFLLDKYENNRKIGKISVPILFIHGTADKVIPYWHGEKLYKLVTTPKKYFYGVQNANHNDIETVAGDKYWQTIMNFADSLNGRN